MPGIEEPGNGAGAQAPGAFPGSAPMSGGAASGGAAPGSAASGGAASGGAPKDPEPKADEGLGLVASAFVADASGADPAPAAAAATAADVPRSRRARLAFRHWRRTRAFWGGLMLVLGGSEILYTYNAPIKVVIHFGVVGIAGFAVPAVVVLLGLLIWFDPEHRVFYSFVGLMASAATWLTSNLGGFFIGMLLGLTGATLAFGWSDAPIPPKKAKAGKAEAVPAGNGDQGPQAAAS